MDPNQLPVPDSNQDIGLATGYGFIGDVNITDLNIIGPVQDVLDPAGDMNNPDQYPMFSDGFGDSSISSSWTQVNGTWSESTWTPPTSSTALRSTCLSRPGPQAQTAQEMLVNSLGTTQDDMEIQANVYLPGALTGDARVGVGLDSGSSGSGYELAFENVDGTLSVQLINDGVGSSTPVTEYILPGGFYQPWAYDTWYTFQLMVVKNPTTGVDTLYGMVGPTYNSTSGEEHGIAR